MVAAAAIIVVLVLAANVAIAIFLRSWVAEESRTETRLHDPHTHTVAYAIPNGIDPVVVKLGLTKAGFTSVIDVVSDAECLRVECDQAERARVRSVIEAVHMSDYDGSELKLDRVVFQDER